MPKPQRAPIGVALIARNAEKTLGPCLASFAPYVNQLVVCVDRLTKDKTAQVARRYGAEVHPIDVSEPHTCPQHGEILAQDFAKARNESFSYLDRERNDFLMWADADDVIENAQLLPALAKNCPEEAIGFWAPYWYASVVKEGVRQVTTLFHRERILRTKYRGQPVQWEWQHRVHEVVVPTNIQGAQWIQNEDIRWVHQDDAHKSSNSAPRNLTLLEIELEESPNDPRTVFYMGNQYFAMQDWYSAAQWYERYTQQFPDGNPYERWQSYVYLSYACERLGDVGGSLSAAFGAIDTVPHHPEPYWRLAAIYAQTEQPAKAIYWTKRADECPDAPFFAFKNPLDRTFNKLLPLADAHAQMGDVAEARRYWQMAVETLPDETIVEKVRQADMKLLAEKGANDFLGVAAMVDEDEVLSLYEKLPAAVKTFGRARNVAMTLLRQKRREGTQPHIIFYCPGSWEPWAPPSMQTTGIGGSETAVVEIARRFAAAGWMVDVYGNPGWMEGVHDDVGYWDMGRYKTEPCDVFVGWRCPQAHDACPEAKQRVLWCHDLNYGPQVREAIQPRGEGWSVVLGVSGWHARMLQEYYDIPTYLMVGMGPTTQCLSYVPNGIDMSRFEVPEDFRKVPYQCVYASSPDRGLTRLLGLWPLLRKTEPEATLHVAYGWETMDRMIAMGRPDLQRFKDDVMALVDKTEGVVWRGRLPQDELAKLYAESYLWLYPTDFLEVSCISAMEAMAGGCVPVTTKCGALPETIGEAGLLVPGPTTSRGYQETWVNVARGAMSEANLRLTYAAMGLQRSKELTWDAAFARWLEVLGIAGEPDHEGSSLSQEDREGSRQTPSSEQDGAIRTMPQLPESPAPVPSCGESTAVAA